MKKLLMVVLSFVFAFSIVGCAPKNQELENLKKENIELKAEVQELEKRMKTLVDVHKTIDLKVEGNFTIHVHKICPDYELGGDEYRFVLAQFFQSEPFLFRVKKEDADKMKEDQNYTFKFDDEAIIHDFDSYEYKNNSYRDEAFIASLFEHIELVGVAKKDELGLNCNRIKVNEIVSDPKL